MTKVELIASVAEKAEISKKDAERAVSATIESIQEGLKADGKVQIVGFGTFEVRDRAAREGKNPKTKEPIHIPATKVPAFKAGKGLKEYIKG